MAYADVVKVAYRRLRNDFDSVCGSDDEDIREKVVGPLRTGHYRLRRLHIHRKFRLKVNRCLRRKARAVWVKFCRRLRESRSHLGDLFAGNHLFVQVNPTPIKQIAHTKAAA